MSIVLAAVQSEQSRLTKVATELFGQAELDIWRGDNGAIYMTSEQIGCALEYSHPVQAIQKLFERNRDRLVPKSVVVSLGSTDGKAYETRLFNEKGIYEIVRWSRQPKADEFYDWVFEVISQVRKTGSYNIAPTSEREIRTHILKAVLETEERTNALEQRVEVVERNTTLDYGEQRRLNKAVNRKVYSLTRDRNEKSEYFKQLHREIKDRWAVQSYRDVLRVELDEVLKYIDAWKPRIV